MRAYNSLPPFTVGCKDQEDDVERPQLLKAILRHPLSSLHVSFTAPIESLPVALEPISLSRRVKHADAFWNNFFPDAVSGDDRDVQLLHVTSTLPFLGRNQRQNGAHIGCGIQGFDESDDFSSLGLLPFCIFGAS
jgi:hypothetical protein